ncbi:MAG: hypothetical protein E6K85_04305 [Thaumarchaeota archaeon]|nr:MAG: hypothetical protein E6K85_04305 [Nitrososphaerota archaeon]
MMYSTIILLLLAGLILIPAGVYAQERGPTKEELIEANYSGPVYLDSFWTSSSNNRTEVDVGPGDGASTLAVVLVNRGPSDIVGITGRLALPADFKATGKSAGAPAVATFNQLAAVGDMFTLFFDLDVLDTASVGEYTAQLSVDYSKFFETGAPRNAQMDVPFRLTGEVIVSVSRISINEGNASAQIIAGKIEDYEFSVTNNGTAPMTNVVVTMESPSESVKILGDSRWTIQRIDEDSKANLATRLFAANSLIGNPASFDVAVKYSSNGQSSTENFVLGTYVAGEISIRAYDIAINYIGSTPNIVGNLLNEGNTVALFTTIEITDAKNLVSNLPPPQYIGDLQENSPLPFSIPVDVDTRSGEGTYPVSLKISYKDNLREIHTLDINSGVQFVPKQPSDESAQNSGIFANMPVGIGAAAVVAAIAIAVVFKRRKKAALKRTFQAGKDDDIESVLDSRNKQDHK